MKLKLDLDKLAVETFDTELSAISPAQKTYSMVSCFVCDWLSEMVC